MTESQPHPMADARVIENSHILVAEDTKAMRRLEVMFLRKVGANVEEAEDGEEALTKLHAPATAGLPFHLLVMDINMPRLNGLELLKSMRGDPALKETPAIVVSSEAERKMVTGCAALGVSGYLVKPIQTKTLRETVALALKRAQHAVEPSPTLKEGPP